MAGRVWGFEEPQPFLHEARLACLDDGGACKELSQAGSTDLR